MKLITHSILTASIMITGTLLSSEPSRPMQVLLHFFNNSKKLVTYSPYLGHNLGRRIFPTLPGARHEHQIILKETVQTGNLYGTIEERTEPTTIIIDNKHYEIKTFFSGNKPAVELVITRAVENPYGAWSFKGDEIAKIPFEPHLEIDAIADTNGKVTIQETKHSSL